jgi:hypothetical protein
MQNVAEDGCVKRQCFHFDQGSSVASLSPPPISKATAVEWRERADFVKSLAPDDGD